MVGCREQTIAARSRSCLSGRGGVEVEVEEQRKRRIFTQPAASTSVAETSSGLPGFLESRCSSAQHGPGPQQNRTHNVRDLRPFNPDIFNAAMHDYQQRETKLKHRALTVSLREGYTVTSSAPSCRVRVDARRVSAPAGHRSGRPAKRAESGTTNAFT